MPEHSIVHVDIPAEDPQAASRFYSELFGWKTQTIPSMAYIRFQSPNGLTGGFVEPGGDVEHRIGEMLVYFGSDDIETDLRRAEELGGKTIVAKTEIPNTGAFAVLQDPAGNRLGLFHRTGFVTG